MLFNEESNLDLIVYNTGIAYL